MLSLESRDMMIDVFLTCSMRPSKNRFWPVDAYEAQRGNTLPFELWLA